MIARVDAIPHRRFIKTHSPADCTPIFTECRYLAVYRDGRDALVSWANHRRKMRPDVVEALNVIAARDGVAPWPPVWDGDMDTTVRRMGRLGTPHGTPRLVVAEAPPRAVRAARPLRRPPVRDLGGEMPRIADWLDVYIPTLRSGARSWSGAGSGR